ncbi:MAG: prepilin-type N-terminal cleavage/methylation domain-containing protein [Oceanisphaera sp.]|uniref:PilW family protein n=1 Tax=Oceanisphaera sp. TaxID=1929979 RepID=UPI003C7538F6
MLSRHHGFTIVELLIAMVAGLVVLSGALSLFITVLATGNTNLMLSRLNQEVQAVGDLISRDLQKAGYHPEAAADLALNRPISTNSAAHYVFSVADDLYTEPSTTGSHCLRLKYWDAAQSSGKKPIVRIYSYHRGTQKLTVRTKHNPSDNTALSTLCGSGSQLISSKEIKIEQLLFTPIPAGPSSSGASLYMTLSASHARRPNLIMSLQRHIYLRNEGSSP